MNRICRGVLLITLLVAGAAEAAAPVFRSASVATSSSGGVTSHSFTLPATIESGDLIGACLAFDGDAFSSFDTSGYTLLHAGATTAAVDFRAYVKVADGAEDGGTISVTTSVAEVSSGITFVVQDWYGTLAGVEDGGGSGSGTGSNSDTENLAPSWGSADTLWFSCTGIDVANALTTYPSNYDSLTSPQAHNYNANGGGSGVASGLGARALTASSENPGAWAHGTAGSGWEGVTIAVRPAAAGGATIPIFQHHQLQQVQ